MPTDPRIKDNRLRISKALIVGILLTIADKFLDAYTYLSRGGVFANEQAENLVLLGIRLAERNFH